MANSGLASTAKEHSNSDKRAPPSQQPSECLHARCVTESSVTAPSRASTKGLPNYLLASHDFLIVDRPEQLYSGFLTVSRRLPNNKL